jgi:YD repeat-containing protein
VNENDDAMQIRKITQEDGTQWRYDYNDRREVISGTKHVSTATTAAEINGYGSGYTFDDIGNRTQMSTGTPRDTTSYSANSLNQYAAAAD